MLNGPRHECIAGATTLRGGQSQLRMAKVHSAWRAPFVTAEGGGGRDERWNL